MLKPDRFEKKKRRQRIPHKTPDPGQLGRKAMEPKHGPVRRLRVVDGRVLPEVEAILWTPPTREQVEAEATDG